jgi:hypothetical protein
MARIMTPNTTRTDFGSHSRSATSFQNQGEPEDLVHILGLIANRLATLEHVVIEIHEIVQGQHFEKEWYTTAELSEILGKSQFTVQERWCNQGRIECDKDPDSGKWRIPGHEVRRLRAGCGLLPRKV